MRFLQYNEVMTDHVIHVGINAYEANVAKRVGSNKYAHELLCELERQTREDHEHIGPVTKKRTVRFEWTVYLPSPALIDLPKQRPGFTYRIIPPKKLWTQWRLPFDLYFGGLRHDVFLSLGHYAPRLCPFPSVVCVLDLAFLKFPQFFLKKDVYQLKEWTKYSVKQAKQIVTISESTKADIVAEYKKSPEDITIIYPGIDTETKLEGGMLDAFGQDTQSLLAKYGLEANQYIISVGTIQPRKNIISAIHAFEQFNSSQNNSYKFVLIGKPGWMTTEFDEAVANSPQKQNIILTGFVSDWDKYVLLRSALCSVLVGYYEGFGIPAIESLSAGITPVVANAASLPEVVGKFGILVDPYSVESIAKGFADAAAAPPSPMRRAEMREWAKQFSWEESGSKVLDLLEEKFSSK